MINHGSDIDAALLHSDPIPRERFLLWIEGTLDLRTLSKLYRITAADYYRIQPELGKDATCALIRRYLLGCIRENVADDKEIEGRYEAAQDLQAWFYHLLEMKEEEVLRQTAQAVTDLFLECGEDVRNAIETGLLEHVLERAALRSCFEHWSADDRLAEAWRRALEWGVAHPDFTWELLQQLRKVQEK